MLASAKTGAGERLTHDEAYWAHFAEAAGWYQCVDGQWLRLAGRNEVPESIPEGVTAEIKAPTAHDACQLDGLGPQSEKSAGDRAAQLTVEGMADAMRANHANCTEDLLRALGYPLRFQQENKDAAIALANRGFVHQVEAEGGSDESTVARMREAVGQIMPSLKDVVAGLRYRGFSDRQINLYTRRVVNLAARDFVSITLPRSVQS